MSGNGYVGRLAPSPTGALHLGNVRTFLVAWLRARSQGGKVLFRMEDLDHPKDKPGAAAQAVEDLTWLGFDWDGECVQSERKALYRSALEFLRSQGLAYPCVCTRRDVEAAQSAPHAGEQLRYPGTCRGRFASWAEACAAKAASLPCWRFRVPDGTVVRFVDAFAGPFEQDVAATLGDFPLARDEGGAGYTLACAVDDLLTGVTEVVRGDDLLPATPAQILLLRALNPWVERMGAYDDGCGRIGDAPLPVYIGRTASPMLYTDRAASPMPPRTRGEGRPPCRPPRTRQSASLPPSPPSSLIPHPPSLIPHLSSLISHHSSLIPHPPSPIPRPSYLHVPLVVGPDGRRLAKRHGDTRVAAFREAGRRPEEILGALAATCGWAAKGERVSLRDLIGRFDLSTIPHEPAVMTNV